MLCGNLNRLTVLILIAKLIEARRDRFRVVVDILRARRNNRLKGGGGIRLFKHAEQHFLTYCAHLSARLLQTRFQLVKCVLHDLKSLVIGLIFRLIGRNLLCRGDDVSRLALVDKRIAARCATDIPDSDISAAHNGTAQTADKSSIRDLLKGRVFRVRIVCHALVHRFKDSLYTLLERLACKTFYNSFEQSVARRRLCYFLAERL